jgi:hypothetical protein
MNFFRVFQLGNSKIQLHIRIQHKMANLKEILFYFLDHFRIEIFGSLLKKTAVFVHLTRELRVNYNSMVCVVRPLYSNSWCPRRDIHVKTLGTIGCTFRVYREGLCNIFEKMAAYEPSSEENSGLGKKESKFISLYPSNLQMVLIKDQTLRNKLMSLKPR